MKFIINIDYFFINRDLDFGDVLIRNLKSRQYQAAKLSLPVQNL